MHIQEPAGSVLLKVLHMPSVSVAEDSKNKNVFNTYKLGGQILVSFFEIFQNISFPNYCMF